MRIIIHLLSFSLSGLNHLEANVEDQVRKILQEDDLELLILRNAVVQLKKLNYEVGNSFLLYDELQVRSLTTNDEGLKNNWQQRLNSLDHLMVVLGHLCIAPLILVLDDIVHAFESSSFQLIDLIVEYLEAGDTDHGHVVRRMWNLHAERESANENLGQFPTCHESNVTRVILLLACQSSENSQNHTHECAHDLCLL